MFGAGHQLIGSSAIGNGAQGMVFNAGGAGGVQVRRANVYANGLTAVAPNCGIQNSPGVSVGAGELFWAAASGPGGDPADAICGPDPVSVDPVAAVPFKVKTKIKP